MRRLQPHDILRIWERGRNEPPADRALTILAAAHPDVTRDELAHLTIGQRDGRLLDLRERMLGPALEACVRCPRCGEHLEITMSTSDIRISQESGPMEEGMSLKLKVGTTELAFRLPNTTDLVAAGGCGCGSSARGMLLRRCVQEATTEGKSLAVEQLPAEVVDRLAARMAECDPQAEILLALECPACRHAWEGVFDIVTFLWQEIAMYAERLLMEVHALASAYKWSEADILSMSPTRRQFYLNALT